MGRKRHNIVDVIEYWRNNMDSMPNLCSYYIGWGEPFCFSCEKLFPESPDADTWQGQWIYARKYFVLAHLKDYWIDQDDEVSDVVPLCEPCHNKMPPFDNREDAMAWVDSKQRVHEKWAHINAAAQHLIDTAPVFVPSKGIKQEEPDYIAAKDLLRTGNCSFDELMFAVQMIYAVDKAYTERQSL